MKEDIVDFVVEILGTFVCVFFPSCLVLKTYKF